MRHVLAVGFGLALWLGLSGPASAAFVLAVSNPGVINPGQSVLVTVTVSWNGVGPNFLAPGSEGLNAATIGLRQSNAPPGSVTAAANPAVGTDVIPGPGFNGNNAAFGAGSMPPGTGTNLIGAFVNVANNGAVFASDALANTPVTLGQLRITGATGGPVTVNIDRLDPSAGASSFGQFVSGAGRALDNPVNGGVIGSTTQFSVVPEPTSMALVGMAASGFLGTIWRKRRKTQAETVVEETPLAV